jgi:hypothetical protein
MRRGKLHGTEVKSDAVADLFQAKMARALVMTYVGQLVADGHAECDLLENGDVQLRCHTGKTFLLAETMIVRIA